MARNTALVIAIFCFGLMLAASDACARQCSNTNLLGADQKKNVTLRATNYIRHPNLEVEIKLHTLSTTLISMLQEAADTNSTFKFTATYFGAPLGYFIEAVNNVFANSSASQYWQILDGKLKPTTLGASSYMPEDGETVTFNLTTWN